MTGNNPSEFEGKTKAQYQPSSRSAAVRWGIVIAALLGWGIFDLITEGALNAPMIVLSLGLGLYWAGRLILRNQQKAGPGD